MTISNRHSFYILIIIALISAAGIIWFDYGVLLRSITTTSHVIIQTRQQIDMMDQREAYLPIAKKGLASAMMQKENLDIITSFSNGLEFINFLEEIARDSGNELTFDVTESATPTFRVQLTGSFNNLILFLRKMSVAPTSIQLFAITRGPADDQGTVLTSDISLTPIFSLPHEPRSVTK